MFDQEIRANGSSVGVALVLYCMLITFFLLAVIWPVTKEFKYANRFIKVLMIILLLTHYFPVVREDVLDLSRNINSGAFLGIRQNTAEGLCYIRNRFKQKIFAA